MIPVAPRVSVCIPTFRGEATLGAAIESVLSQSLTDFELVVIDDGSPGDTRAIIERYSDPRISYQRNPINLGPEGNWNRCLELASGTYFKLLPHDDLLHPKCLERQVAALDSDASERLALVFCAREVLGPDGRKLTRRGYPGRGEGAISARQVIGSCIRRGTNLVGEPGAVLIRRSLAQQVGAFDATNPYVIDLDYWFRLLGHGDAYYIADTLASFRVSRSQWSVAIGHGQSEDFRHFVDRVSASGRLPASAVDRLLGRMTPALNKLARMAFYRLYLR